MLLSIWGLSGLAEGGTCVTDILKKGLGEAEKMVGKLKP
jgi:hypothetical protein